MIRHKRAHWAIAFLAAFLSAFACASPIDPEPRVIRRFGAIPDIPSAIDTTVERRAWALFRHTVASQIAADTLPTREHFHGIVVEERGDAYIVTFVRGEGPEAQAAHQVQVFTDGRVKITSHDPPLGLSMSQHIQLRVQEAVLADSVSLDLCSSAHQVLVLPHDLNPGWLAYLIAMPDRAGLMHLGGHYRYEFDPAGELKIRRRKLVPTCATWELEAEVAAFVVAFADPNREPVETDILASLLYDIPLFMTAATKERRVWAVDSHGIHDVTDQFPMDE